MTEVWAGDIVVEGLPTTLEDVHLWNTTATWTNVLPVNASLCFLSNVHVPSIPLYTFVGPLLELSTDSTITSAWLSDRLNMGDLSSESSALWWSNASKQLDIGILLGVNGLRNEGAATEVLLVAEAERSQGDLPESQCPSPIVLSDHTLQNSSAVPSMTFKVFAIPLCSEILKLAQKGSESVPSHSTTLTAPNVTEESKAVKPSIQKRRKMSDLFDDASQQRRRLKGRGGEAISKALSETDHIISQRGPTSVLNREENVVVSKGGQMRVLEASHVAVLPKGPEMRPVSRTGLPNGKPSSGRRPESIHSSRQASVLLDGESGFTLQNKTALTKMVMAGMRLHGLQQKKKKNSFSNKPVFTLHDTALSEVDSLQEGDDNYKLIYHQTFKAAMFTFRTYFSNRLLGQDVMRDVVDRLLLLFCTDPLGSTDHEDAFTSVPGSAQQETPTAFDLPSSASFVETQLGQVWSTPSTKKPHLRTFATGPDIAH